MPTKAIDFQIQAHISEFEKLREEILHHLNTQQQSLLITLGSASVAIPILLSQTANIPAPIIAVILYALSTVFSIIGMNFATAAFTVGAIGEYVRRYLQPELNRLLATDPQHKVFYWETFLRQERAKFITFVAGAMGPIGSTILILLPSVAALLAAQYAVQLSIVQPIQQDAAAQFISSWAVPLSTIAWGALILCTLAVVFSTLYHTLVGRWAVL